MTQKATHFVGAHLRRVTFAVEENKSLNPIDVRLLGPDRIMFKSAGLPHTVEQFHLAILRPRWENLWHAAF